MTMDKDESIALLKKGKHRWNEWARELLREREAIRERGTWVLDKYPWHDKAKADFTAVKFKKPRHDFFGFIFPGAVCFTAAEFRGVSFLGAKFEGEAGFKGARFFDEPCFQDTVFSGDVDFREAEFSSKADFEKATFSASAVFGVAPSTSGSFLCPRLSFDDNPGPAKIHGDACFTRAEFHGETDFAQVKFSDKAIFTGATFHGVTSFCEATLSGAAFDGATFANKTEFVAATFSGNAVFKEARFSDTAEFMRATFSKNARFNEATFSGVTDFSWAAFSDGALFSQTNFATVAMFLQCVFEGYTSFENAEFKNQTTPALFTAINAKSFFSFARASFLAAPDLTQSHFLEAPRLDNVDIATPAFVGVKNMVQWHRDLPKHLRAAKTLFKHDPDATFTARWRAFTRPFKGGSNAPARWRALKRLAAQSLDHGNEIAFFKNEIIAKRWDTDQPWHAALWAGYLYQLLSDFGRSILRPLLFWLVSIPLFACLYLDARPDPAANTDPCDPRRAALGASALKASLVFGLGADGENKLNAYHKRLYGKPAAPRQHRPTDNARPPTIPFAAVLTGIAQSLLSATLAFLLGLAIRNHFKIR